jgi:hypothetical protein
MRVPASKRTEQIFSWAESERKLDMLWDAIPGTTGDNPFRQADSE